MSADKKRRTFQKRWDERFGLPVPIEDVRKAKDKQSRNQRRHKPKGQR